MAGSQSTGATGATGGEKSSIRRRVTRSIKRVLRTGKAKEAAPSVGEPSTRPAAPTPTAKPEPTTTAEERPKMKPHRPPKVPTTPPPPMSAADRARELFRKHGLEINTADWPLSTTPATDRVQKDIRMRVHRTCHKCETTFGPDKVCTKCNHKRCKKCPRSPVKKAKDKGKEKVGAKTGITPGYKKRRGDYAYGITIPSKKAGGQDLVRKPVRQRIHRKCHRCNTDFKNDKVCPSCKHNRCKRCPREPFKPNKPAGYYDSRDPDGSDDEQMFPPPPRRTYKRPRHRVRWTCKTCSSTFTEKNKICGGCGGHRDEIGSRDPPKKDKKTRPSTGDLERLGRRLQETTISA